MGSEFPIGAQVRLKLSYGTQGMVLGVVEGAFPTRLVVSVARGEERREETFWAVELEEVPERPSALARLYYERARSAGAARAAAAGR